MVSNLIIVPVCDPEMDVMVVSGDVYNDYFSVENLLTNKNKRIWLSPLGNSGSFILNLGCKQTIEPVQLVNTINRGYRNVATKQFKYIDSLFIFV